MPQATGFVSCKAKTKQNTQKNEEIYTETGMLQEKKEITQITKWKKKKLSKNKL